MWVLDKVKAIQCPAALFATENIFSMRCKVGSNGHEEINVAMKSVLCWAPD